MEDKPSRRLIDQRLRNRMMEAMHTLAKGNPGVREVGASDYFNNFFDIVPDDCQSSLNSALSMDEREQLANLWHLVNEACDDTPKTIIDEELIATGWPERIAPQAIQTLSTFQLRGRSDEANDEEPG